MKITWQSEELPEHEQMLGHGVCIYGPDADTEKPRLVAFVDGFGWLHQGSDTVVRFDPRHFPTDSATSESLRSAVEAYVRARRLHGEMAPGFPLHVNG